jgi:hypothetical protein
LLDFDEDKRSCRRKLERHNKRRRRKPDSKDTLQKETDEQLDLSVDGSGSAELREGKIQITFSALSGIFCLFSQPQLKFSCSCSGKRLNV